jgi:hypothetical protein
LQKQIDYTDSFYKSLNVYITLIHVKQTTHELIHHSIDQLLQNKCTSFVNNLICCPNTSIPFELVTKHYERFPSEDIHRRALINGIRGVYVLLDI